MFRAGALRREIGQSIPALAALGVGELGEYGVKLDGATAHVASDSAK